MFGLTPIAREWCANESRVRSRDEPPLIRHADFSEPSRKFTDDGVGFVRIYPHSAGSFDFIHSGVRSSLKGDGSATAGAAAGTSSLVAV